MAKIEGSYIVKGLFQCTVSSKFYKGKLDGIYHLTCSKKANV